MNAMFMDMVDVSFLDREFLDDRSRLRAAFAADQFLAKDPYALKLWCHLRARYALPTLELLRALRDIIGDRSALEIGAGNGDLGYLLGIRETDSYIQQTPELRAYYATLKQAPTNPAPEVRRADALEAIRKFKPRVVVGAWITRKFEEGKDVSGKAEASVYGPREEEILAAPSVETYVHVGHLEIHSQKTILSRPHRTVFVRGALSRSFYHDGNVIWIWDRAL